MLDEESVTGGYINQQIRADKYNLDDVQDEN